MIQAAKYSLVIIGLLFALSCGKEEPVDDTATVFFSIDHLQEVENATIPLGINIGIDNPLHAGGSIQVSVTGGVYGQDFTTSEESADFTIEVEANSLYARFSILPVDDDIIEDNFTLTIALTGTTGALELGDKTSFTLTILDNDKEPEPPMVDFADAPSVLEESSGTLTLTVFSSDTLTEDATIEVVVDAASTAVAGEDYTLNGMTATTVQLFIAAGTDSASLTLEILDDAIEEELETLVLNLSNPSVSVLIGTTRPGLAFTINDDDITPFEYLETFESNDGTTDFLTTVMGYQNVLADQTITPENLISLITSAGAFSDPNDVTATSDNGLNMFYNSNSDPAFYGELDNLVITPVIDATGVLTVNIDVSYAFLNQNNGQALFYWSQDYDGSGVFNESEWTLMGSETAAGMNGEGFGNNIYKRETFYIEPSAPFYLAMRVKQTIDDTYYRTRWRFDNVRVHN